MVDKRYPHQHDPSYKAIARLLGNEIKDIVIAAGRYFVCAKPEALDKMELGLDPHCIYIMAPNGEEIPKPPAGLENTVPDVPPISAVPIFRIYIEHEMLLIESCNWATDALGGTKEFDLAETTFVEIGEWLRKILGQIEVYPGGRIELAIK